MLASYLGDREEKPRTYTRRSEANTCVSLLPRCGWVSGGNVLASTYVWVGVEAETHVLASTPTHT